MMDYKPQRTQRDGELCVNCELWLGRNEPARLKEYFLTLACLPFKREEYKLELSGNLGLVSGRGYLLILPPLIKGEEYIFYDW